MGLYRISKINEKIISMIAVTAYMIFPLFADPVRIYDVDDYAQSGTEKLIMHLDAIRNVGSTVSHDGTATTWTDLTGNHSFSTKVILGLTQSTSVPNLKWTDDAWVTDGTNYFATTSDAVTNALAHKAFTLEMFVSHPIPAKPTDEKWYEYWFTCGNNDKRQFIIDLRNEPNLSKLINCVQYLDGSRFNGQSFIPSNDTAQYNVRQHVAIVCDQSGATTYIDGIKVDHTNGRNTMPTTNFVHIASGSTGNEKYMLGAGSEICAIRVTAKALTVEDIDINRRVDFARFREGAAVSKDGQIHNIIVDTNQSDMKESLGCGKYIASEGDVFSVPKTLMTNGIGYTFTGYTLETWDESSSAWSSPISCESCTYSASGTGLVRLTWCYNRVLVSQTAYDTNDYVQSGNKSLIMQLDGIANGNSATWTDLTGNHTFTVGGGTPSFANGAWQADGATYFTTTSDAARDALAAKAFTLEMVISHTKPTKDTYEYWTAFGSGTNRNLVTEIRKSGRSNPLIHAVEYRQNGWNSKSSHIAANSGITKWGRRQYVAVVCDANGATTYCNGTNKIHTTKGGSVIPTVNSLTIGAADNKEHTYPLLKGAEICAVRVTGKALEKDELLTNSKIDLARFANIGDVTVVNGAVGDTGMNGESSVSDGVYNVETGTWIFTAPEIKIDGNGTYAPRLLVEDWDAVTETWKPRTAKPVSVDSFAYTAESGRIRITWTWARIYGLVFTIK